MCRLQIEWRTGSFAKTQYPERSAYFEACPRTKGSPVLCSFACNAVTSAKNSSHDVMWFSAKNRIFDQFFRAMFHGSSFARLLHSTPQQCAKICAFRKHRLAKNKNVRLLKNDQKKDPSAGARGHKSANDDASVAYGARYCEDSTRGRSV